MDMSTGWLSLVIDLRLVPLLSASIHFPKCLEALYARSLSDQIDVPKAVRLDMEIIKLEIGLDITYMGNLE